jgi:predicted MFS family arabinose efflux permease
VFAALFGVSYLATVVVTTMCVLAVAPPGTKGLAVGLMWSVHQLGATLSSQLGALSRDATGSYLAATLVGAGCALVSIVAVLAATFPERAPAAPAPAGTHAGDAVGAEPVSDAVSGGPAATP